MSQQEYELIKKWINKKMCQRENNIMKTCDLFLQTDQTEDTRRFTATGARSGRHKAFG